ncbi:MAG TPA: hypothetical protein PLK27_08285 [Neisseria sp.]|jgi:hypothetical protein|nr:hypothetical protein [Neisseria sp.]
MHAGENAVKTGFAADQRQKIGSTLPAARYHQAFHTNAISSSGFYKMHPFCFLLENVRAS